MVFRAGFCLVGILFHNSPRSFVYWIQLNSDKKRCRVPNFDTYPYGSKKEKDMITNSSIRRTEIWLASLWLVTAFGAIAGTFLMNSVLNAPDYLTTVFPRSATIISGM